MRLAVLCRLAAVLPALCCLLVAGVPSPAGGLPAARADGHVGLEVTDLGPGVLRPGGTLTVRAVVSNRGSAPLEGLSVRLLGYTAPLTSREDVREWAAGESGRRTGDRFLGDTPLPDVPAGGSAPVELSVPAETFGLPRSGSSWGPRGLTLDVFDVSAGVQQAVARAFTVWDPRPAEDAQQDPASISLLVPLTAGAPEIAEAVVPAAEMAELTSSGGRLASVLEVASRQDVAWALDPAVLSSAAAAAEGEAAEVSAAGEGDAGRVGQWLDALRAAAPDRDVLALPQADPDLAAVAHAEAGELYRMASRQGRETVGRLLDAPARSDLAWPAAGGADAAALQLAADAGAALVVLSAGSQPPAGDLDATPTGRSTVPAGTARLDGLLVDTALSTTLADATSGDDGVLETSLLLAETAAITLEDPGAGPHLLLAMPRDWSPDVPAAAAALDELRAAPWVRMAPLGELVAADPADIEREPVRPPEAGGEELAAGALRSVLDAVRTVRSIATALTMPDETLDDVETSAVAATSVAWRDRPEQWREQVGAFVAAAHAVPTGVQVLPGSAVNVVSSTADLPVSIANELEQDVVAAVRVQPRSSRLRVPADVEVRLPATSTSRVAVPVRAVANGDTEVVVTVRAPDGTVLGEPVTIPVRVRADWETRGMLVAGAAVAAIVVIGLVRTIRRGRRRDGMQDPVSLPERETVR